MRPVFKHIDESTIAFRKDSRKQIEDRGEETGYSCLFKAVLVPGTAIPPPEDERRYAKGSSVRRTGPALIELATSSGQGGFQPPFLIEILSSSAGLA